MILFWKGDSVIFHFAAWLILPLQKLLHNPPPHLQLYLVAVHCAKDGFVAVLIEKTQDLISHSALWLIPSLQKL